MCLPKDPDKYLQLSKLAFENATKFISDAEMLINERSFGHALALSQFACEETVKSQVCWFVAKSIWPLEENDLIRAVFSSHSAKYQMVIGNVIGVYFHNLLLSLAEGKKVEVSEGIKGDMIGQSNKWDGAQLDKVAETIERDRQMSLYVSYDQDGKPTTPLSISEHEALQMHNFAKALLTCVKRFIEIDERGIGNLREHFKTWPKDAWQWLSQRKKKLEEK